MSPAFLSDALIDSQTLIRRPNTLHLQHQLLINTGSVQLTSSAPKVLTISAFPPEQTPTTLPVSPTFSLTICTTMCPIPPLAPLTSTLSPFFNPAFSTRIN